MRIGTGYDIHKLAARRKLVLGGVTIKHTKGLVGHSDGDVLTHAIIDALLGAAAMGDIGTRFPDTASKYKGISSLKLLAEVSRLVRSSGYKVENVDATVICEKPKIAPHVEEIRKTLSEAMVLMVRNISIKAKTNEKMDATGRGEAIVVHAVAALEEV